MLDNGLFAIQVPRPDRQRFKKPVPANTLPCPILAFRGGSARVEPEGSAPPVRDAMELAHAAAVPDDAPDVDRVHEDDGEYGGHVQKPERRIVDADLVIRFHMCEHKDIRPGIDHDK